MAFKESGADERLYAAMTKYADYIYERFYVRKDAGFFTCGHPEIELALIRLYEVSGQEKYLRLAEYFVETRGRHKETMYDFDDPACAQDDAPVRELRKARGHAVRALYLYTAMADLARIRQDETLAAACETLFRDIVDTKMYLTAARGRAITASRFTFAYHLPDFSAYSETCAGIALALFCDRLAKRKNRAEYHEIFERVLYNVVSAGIGRDGKSFFYVNPLEMHAAYVDYNDSLAVPQACPLPERVEVFDCSCCPPNLLRFFASLSGYLYGEEDGVVYVNQYVTSRTEAAGAKIEVVSELPYSGRVRIAVSGRVGRSCASPPGIRPSVSASAARPRARQYRRVHSRRLCGRNGDRTRFRHAGAVRLGQRARVARQRAQGGGVRAAGAVRRERGQRPGPRLGAHTGPERGGNRPPRPVHAGRPGGTAAHLAGLVFVRSAGRRTVYAAAHPVLCLGQPRPRRYAGVVSVNRDGEIIPVVSVHSYG